MTTEATPTPPGFMICPDCDGMGERAAIDRFPPYGETIYHCYRCEQWNGFVPIDHTSGVMRCRYNINGGHVHCRVFGPYSGQAGQLIFRVEEWNHFKATNAAWHFVDDAEETIPPMAWQ